MKTKLIYLICLPLLSMLCSCDAWLSLEPEDGVTRKDFWQSKEQVQSAVIGIYCSMMETACVNRLFLWGELRADMVTSGSRPKAAYTSVMAGEIASDNEVCDWSSFYTVINNCNLVLDFADLAVGQDASYTEQDAALFKAEAKTLRALMYFYLYRSFGEVPLMLQGSISDAQEYYVGKSSKDSVMAQIILDLTQAEQVMWNTPSYNMDFPKGRITIWTIKAILADVYLWDGQYDRALKSCEDIIRSNQFRLLNVHRSKVYLEATPTSPADTVYYVNTTDVDLLFDAFFVKGNSEESIFELNFNELKTNGFYELFSTARNVLVANTENLESELFPLYEADEMVYDIRSNSFSYKGSQIWKYMGLSRTGLPRTAADSYANWIFYRYADILLMKAEILIRQGGQDNLLEAYQLIEQIRQRANALDTEDGRFDQGSINASELEVFLLEERAREFLFEGKRWYDVLRFAQYNNYSRLDYLMQLALKSAPTGKQQSLQNKYGDFRSHYWPMYEQELEANKALIQNEFYAPMSMQK